jgi:LysR family transcriptional regulator of abg operon
VQIRQLKHFEALYRLRSFVRAAEVHRLTQPALSRSIKNLEDVLGQRLFDRTTHTVEPTDAAEGLIQHARDVIGALDSFEEQAERLLGGATGHVRLGTGPYPAQPLVTRTIRSLSASHHGIQVDVVAGTVRDLHTALLGRELEFVVCDMSKYEDSPGSEEIEVIPLPSEPLAAVVTTDHPLFQAEVTMERAVSFPWAMPTPAPVSARHLPEPFAEALASGRFPFYRLESTAACLDVVRAGRAVTVVPWSLAVEACADGALAYRAVPEFLRTNDGIHLVRNRASSPSTRILIEEIQLMAAAIAGENRTSSSHAMTGRTP